MAPRSEANPAGPDADRPSQAAPHSYHHGNLRDALVLRGIEILDAEGASALSLRRAAREVGVSQTAPLHHFEGKVGYLAAPYHDLFDDQIR